MSTAAGASNTLTVDGWNFVSVCTRIGGSILAELEVESPIGVGFHQFGTEFDYNSQTSAISESGLDDADTTTGAHAVETYGYIVPNALHRVVLSPMTLLASSGPSFAVNATIEDDNVANLPTNDRVCSVDGTVTPTAP